MLCLLLCDSRLIRMIIRTRMVTLMIILIIILMTYESTTASEIIDHIHKWLSFLYSLIYGFGLTFKSCSVVRNLLNYKHTKET